MSDMQAYVDDSRSDIGERTLVLAGYLQTARTWRDFSNAWFSELRSSPAIEYFKMKEAFHLNGQFGGWNRTARDQKVENLARIIRHFKLNPIYSAVSQKKVEELIRPVAPYGLSGAYFHCFEAIVIPIAIEQSKQRELRGAPIQFIFDNQEGEGDQAREIYQAIRMQQPINIKKNLSPEPTFRDDKLTMPLQAADMLAWHIRRNFEEGKEVDQVVPDYLRGIGTLAIAANLDEAYLRRIREGLITIPKLSILKDKNKWKKFRREMKWLGFPSVVNPRTFRRKYAIKQFKNKFRKWIGR